MYCYCAWYLFFGTDVRFNHTPPLWRDLVNILTRKLWHTSSFSLERTDFKNVTFEKIPWAPYEVAEFAEVKRPRNSKYRKFEWKLVKTRWNPKFGRSDLKNDLLTSMTSEGAQWFVFKNYIFKISASSWEKWAIAWLSLKSFKITTF